MQDALTLTQGATSVREKTRFLGWPEIGLVPLLLCAMLIHPLNDLGALTLGSIRVEWIDAGLLVLLVVTVLAAIVRPVTLDIPHGIAPVLLLVFALSYPIVVGLAARHGLESVLRTGRVVAYYLSFFLVWQLVYDRRVARNVLVLMAWMSAVAAVYGGVSRLMGWQWVNAMSQVWFEGEIISRGYGWWSAMPWYPYGAVIAVAYAWIGGGSTLRRWLMGAVAAGLVLATVSTYIRGDMVGLILGVATVALLGGRTYEGFLRLWHRFRTALPVLLLVAATLVAATWTQAEPFLSKALIRTLSVVDPTAVGEAGQGTREYRLEAMREGLASAAVHPFGIGYGQPQGGVTQRMEDVAEWATHNYLSWTGFYLGAFGTVITIVALALLGTALFGVARRERTDEWAPVAAFALFVTMVGQSLASTVFFDVMYTYPLVPIVLVVGLRFAVPERSTRSGP